MIPSSASTVPGSAPAFAPRFGCASSPAKSALRFAGEAKEAADVSGTPPVSEKTDTQPETAPKTSGGVDTKNPILAAYRTLDNYIHHAYKTTLGKVMLALDAGCIVISCVPFLHFFALAQPFLWMALYSAVTKKVLWTDAAQKSKH